MRPSVFFNAPLVLCVATGVLSAATQAPSPSPSPATVVPSGVDVVNVDVLVLDRNGRPVEGLRREDFTIKEDGRIQTISSFEPVVVPESVPSRPATRVSTNTLPRAAVERSFVIVFDDANISQYSTEHARKSVGTFIRKWLRPGNEVMIVPTAGGAWWAGRIPEDRESLLGYVEGLHGKYRPDSGPARIWDHEAMSIWLGRDRQASAQVARRWFENNLIPETYPTDRESSRDLDISPGMAMIRAKAQEGYRSAVGRLRLTLDMLARVAESLGQLRGRKDLLLVSEGFIMDPSQPEFRDVVQAARRANAAVHFLDARGPEGALGQAGMPGGSAESGRPVDERDTTTALAFAILETGGARSVALDTGGSVVPPTAGLADAMGRIAEESRTYYLVGYTPANTRRDGSFRKLSVEVSGPGLEVRARRGYYAPKDGERRKEDPDRLDPRVRSALDAPVASGGLPLRLTSYVAGPVTLGKAPVLLVAEADVAALGLESRSGQVSAALETYVVVHGRDGGEVHRQERLVELEVPVAQWEQVRQGGVRFGRDFSLPPGVYQARLLVRDRQGGRLGTVRHEFEVPGDQGLRTSTPILTDVFQGGAPNELPRPIPVAHRVFRAGARLAYAYDVYGATPDAAAGEPRVTAGYVVRSGDGTVVSSVPARPLRPAGQRLSQVIVFTAPADAGDYELLLEVRDEAGRTATRIVDPFTVARGPEP